MKRAATLIRETGKHDFLKNLSDKFGIDYGKGFIFDKCDGKGFTANTLMQKYGKKPVFVVMHVTETRWEETYQYLNVVLFRSGRFDIKAADRCSLDSYWRVSDFEEDRKAIAKGYGHVEAYFLVPECVTFQQRNDSTLYDEAHSCMERVTRIGRGEGKVSKIIIGGKHMSREWEAERHFFSGGDHAVDKSGYCKQYVCRCREIRARELRAERRAAEGNAFDWCGKIAKAEAEIAKALEKCIAVISSEMKDEYSCKYKASEPVDELLTAKMHLGGCKDMVASGKVQSVADMELRLKRISEHANSAIALADEFLLLTA